MKIQYGDKFKIVPKRFAQLRDIGKYFMCDKVRLSKEERTLIEGKVSRVEFDFLFGEVLKGLTKPVVDLIKGEHLATVVLIERRTEEPYCELQFSNRIGVRCESKVFKIAVAAHGISTAKMKRSY